MRTIDQKTTIKANDILFYFKGNVDAVFCHCMEVLDLLYDMNKGKPFEEIRVKVDLYQDILWYVSQIRKETEIPKWNPCSYCTGTEAIHDDNCVLKMHKNSDSK
jgi:hypothetical protein